MHKYLKIVIVAALLFFITPFTAQAAQVHRVTPGETLYQIGQKYGVTVNDILNKNGYLRNKGTIFPRQVLIIPTTSINKTTYRVQPGDTLYKISQQFGVPVGDLARENNLTDWNRIYVGQVLTIPAKGTGNNQNSATYVVKPGDTLHRISLQLGVSMADLARENNLSNWNHIYVGQVLRVPSPIKQPEPSFDYTVSQLAAMFKGTFYLKGAAGTNQIALTFDDGPDALYTPRVLDVLKAYKVPATFFLMGNRAEKYPYLVNRMIAEGHVIGNHTWIHPDLRKVSAEKRAEEITKTEDVLRRITGRSTALMRPPYGAVSKEVLEQMQSMNYKVINWSTDSKDWRDQDRNQLLINTLPEVRGGGILLFHSAGGEGQSLAATVEVLPELIETLSMQGYTFVTLDTLLNVPAYR